MRASGRLLAIAVILAGCATPGAVEDGDSPAAAFPRCEHPWPCGDGSEWPAGLEGPFEALPPQDVRVASFDGVEMDGAVWLPKLPEGVRAPVVVKSTPYLGTCSYQSITRTEPSCSGSASSDARVAGGDNFEELIAAGYAVAIFSVRGTGASGGCYDLWGATEQRDQAALVDWAASQAWSNGRVAMTGLSYAGTTPWEAAVQAPRGLKAILVAGIITDVYLSLSTPQGAIEDGYDSFQVGTAAANSLQPPGALSSQGMLLEYAPVAKDRVCPGTVDILTVNSLAARGDARPKAWFDERRLADRLGDVTAAVLLAQGFQDDDFHRYQEDTIWPRLAKAPKWVVLGQWEHDLDFAAQMETNEHAKSWLDLQLAWLDFWLKGVGDPPRMGVVDYQDTGGAWRASTAWPPADAREEALFLAGDALSPDPGAQGRAFVAAPQGSCMTRQTCPLVPSYCPAPVPTQGSLAYTSAPVERAVTIAGNVFAYLEVESDQAGGTFSVDLGRVPAGGACEAAERVSGGVDLRFHEGNFDAKPFPTGTRTALRVDLYNVALKLEPGDRLAFVVRNPKDRDTREFAPTVTVHGASHLVLPLVEGTLGGDAPTLAYPPRPFAE